MKIIKGMKGSFVLNDIYPCELTKPIWESLNGMTYYGPEHDAFNLHNDVKAVGCDVRKGTQSAKLEFNLAN